MEAVRTDRGTLRRVDVIAAPVRLAASIGVYIAAYALGLALFAWLARRRGLDTAGVRIVVVWGIAGGLIGATLIQLIAGGEAGRTILGGVAGGYLAVIIAKRSIGLQRPLGDLFAVAIAGGEALGRLGCFLAGCCYGRVADVPWAVYDHGAWRHPTQLYSALAAAATLALLLVLERRGRTPENGLFYVQGALLCMSRFIIEFYREPSRMIDGFTVAQWACAAGFLFFAWRLVRLTRVGRRAERRTLVAS